MFWATILYKYHDVGESESFQKFEDDLKEYLEHEFRLEDDIEDDDEEFALGPASSLSSKLPTKSQDTKVCDLPIKLTNIFVDENHRKCIILLKRSWYLIFPLSVQEVIDSFCIVSYYIKRVKIYWTYNIK